MSKTLGIDLGTNSIGLALRNENTFDWYGVYTFNKGVGVGKSGEFSFAAERTKHRSTRRLYNARRYRKWETLKLLIQNKLCPLEEHELLRWKNYTKGVGRTFPLDNIVFNNWIKLDFDGDGIPDYTSPYQLRRELINTTLDLTEEVNKLKVGRALYHITQRRGFRSSRKLGNNEEAAMYKGSPETKTIGRNEYESLIIENGTLGAALASLEDKGERIRNRYTLRSDYEKEVSLILQKQGLLNDSFEEEIKKAIFFQRPLRSQKGSIGNCTMERSKTRCPVSHYEFEEFRALGFINNIKYKDVETGEMLQLPESIRKSLMDDVFLRLKSSFPFSDIRKHILKKGNKNWQLNYKLKADKVSVSGCPTSARLKSVFGECWKEFKILTNKTNIKGQKVELDIHDIWHLLFSYEDEEKFNEYLLSVLELNDEQIKGLNILWNNFPVGYEKLSLKALRNINRFLREGLLYSEATFLAKIPEIIGEKNFNQNKNLIIEGLKEVIKKNRTSKQSTAITNLLISKYHLLGFNKETGYNEKFAYKDFEYELDDSDIKDIINACQEFFGNNTWQALTKELQNKHIEAVRNAYQNFFKDLNRKHIKPLKLIEDIKTWLKSNFPELSESNLVKLYHPSQIDIYPSQGDSELLQSPKTGAFKNPMAYKTLYHLRRSINNLIENGKIDVDTRIVVEVARELNDSNMRNAIESYQRNREAQNREYAIAIAELIKDPDFHGNAHPENETDKNKFRLWHEQLENSDEILRAVNVTKETLKKYRLWKEQQCFCFYTGKPIKLTDLFDNNIIDFEHTIPRSQSFDNSMANQTVCFANYNRKVKGTKLPTQLPNYLADTKEGLAILPRLENWKKKLESLDFRIRATLMQTRNAQDKDSKDRAIRQRHLLQMDYKYWNDKLDRFTRVDIPEGFKNSQLIDTQIISKYAFHYLKTIFKKVDIQKGKTTSDFRKIYQSEQKIEKKSREKHHHHAIDAAILTLIPPPKKAREILEKAYKYEEDHKGVQYHEVPFPGFSFSIIKNIEKDILINNLADKDQSLSPAKKRVRKKGQVVLFKDSEGQLSERIMTGDSIRGQLHLDTFYGKIKVVQRDEEGRPKRDQTGEFIVESKNEGYKYVLRKPIETIKKLDELVDPHLAKMIEKQLMGRTLAQTIAAGVFMIDKKGQKVNKIRRARCWSSISEPLEIKKQTYLSKHEYKHFYYAANGENYAYALYEGIIKQKYVREHEIINLFQLAQLNKINDNSSIELEETKVVNKRGEKVHLRAILRPQMRVIFFIESKEEIKELSQDELSKRLYSIVKFMKDGRMTFAHHLEARTDEQLLKAFPEKEFGKRGKNGFSQFSQDFIAPKLLLAKKNFNFLIENKDFEMTLDGSIKYLF